MSSDAAPASSSASSGNAAGSKVAGSSSYRRSSRIEQVDGSDTVTLVSMDGDSFVVDSSSVVVSKLLAAMVDGPSAAKEIPLPNMRSSVVAKVVEFCQHNRKEPMKNIPQPIPHGMAVSDYVQEWYSGFIKGLGDELLFETLLAANYLDLQPLLEICAATVGLRMMNKTPDEVRREFNITEPFSPEVERTLREENKWSTEPPIGS
eukprot:g15905.t1